MSGLLSLQRTRHTAAPLLLLLATAAPPGTTDRSRRLDPSSADTAVTVPDPSSAGTPAGPPVRRQHHHPFCSASLALAPQLALVGFPHSVCGVSPAGPPVGRHRHHHAQCLVGWPPLAVTPALEYISTRSHSAPSRSPLGYRHRLRLRFRLSSSSVVAQSPLVIASVHSQFRHWLASQLPSSPFW